jgi:hypothetical protein
MYGLGFQSQYSCTGCTVAHQGLSQVLQHGFAIIFHSKIARNICLHVCDDAYAFFALTSIRAIYEVRTTDEKKLQMIFTVIRDPLDETKQQEVKSHYIVSMR